MLAASLQPVHVARCASIVQGLLRHIDEIKALADEYPDTVVLIDHFGFCKANDPASEEWRALLSLASYPQIYVKVLA